MSKPEYHLALSVSHNSSAALMKDGQIIVAVCEERSRRKKNYIGYPKNAVDYCLKKAGITGAELSRVAYTTVDNQGVLLKAKTNTEFSLQDYRDYYGERFYKRRLRGEDCTDYLKWLRDDPKFNKAEEYFDLMPGGEKGGMFWVELKPKATSGSGDMPYSRIGVGMSNGLPAGLELHDNFGTIVLINLSKIRTNINLSPNTFKFSPPAGADVLNVQ